MDKKTVLLLNDTSIYGTLDVVGDPVRADGWFGDGDGFATVQIQTSKFIGRIGIQASLEPDPTEDDWFNIYLSPDGPYLVYNAPIGNGISETVQFNIIGNFLWLRATVDRKNVPNVESLPPDNWPLLGQVTKILLIK